MTFTLKVSRLETSLLKDNTKDWNKVGTEDLLLEYRERGRRASKTLPLSDLETLKGKEVLTFLAGLENDLRVFLRPKGLSSNKIEQNSDIIPVKIDLENKDPKSLSYTIGFISNQIKISDGVSDYSYLSEFMPSWSTARKFSHSNHARAVEPYFSNIKALPSFISKRLEGFYSPSEEFTTHLKTKMLSLPAKSSVYKTLTKKEEENLVDVPYFSNSEITLDFGYSFNTIYIEALGYEHDFELIIEGEYNSAWFTERILISSQGVQKLSNLYHKIHNIIVVPSPYFDSTYIGVKVSNYLNFNSFKYKDRPSTDLSFNGASIKLLDKSSRKEKRVFNLNLSNSDGYFITEDDHIIVKHGSNIYTSKLDLKLDLSIPKDISYNNSRFIEECKIENREYDLELFLPEYLNYTNQDIVAIRVETSKGEIFYLNDQLELTPSKDPIYLDSSITKDSKSITLTIDLITEYVLVRLEDYENKYFISHLIYEPYVNLISVLSLDNIELKLLDVDFKEDPPKIDYADPIIIEDKVWLHVRYKDPVLYNSILVPLEANSSDYKYPLRTFYNALPEGE